MIKYIFGVLTALAGVFFLAAPAGKAVLAAFAANLRAVPASAFATALPGLSEEDLPPPLVSTETVTAATKEAPLPATAPAAETGPDDTFERVMAVYEQDGKEQAADGREMKTGDD